MAFKELKERQALDYLNIYYLLKGVRKETAGDNILGKRGNRVVLNTFQLF